MTTSRGEAGMSLVETFIGIAILAIAAVLFSSGWGTYQTHAITERNRDAANAAVREVTAAARKVMGSRVVLESYAGGIGDRMNQIFNYNNANPALPQGINITGCASGVSSCKSVVIQSLSKTMALDSYTLQSTCRTLATNSPLRGATYTTALSTMSTSSCVSCPTNQVPILQILKNGVLTKEFPPAGAADSQASWPIGIALCTSLPATKDRMRFNVRAFYVRGAPGKAVRDVQFVEDSYYAPLNTNQNLQLIK